MNRSASLHALLDASVQRYPEQPAVEDSAATLSYAELGALSDRLRDRLAHGGVGIGDRVGICLHKSVDSLACIFGILKAGAAYVPVGPHVPASRNALVFSDCGVKAVLTERQFVQPLREELARLEANPELCVIDESGGGRSLSAWLDERDRDVPAPPAATAETGLDDLAYVLYTSGSTGRPKGVMLSHGNGLCFVNWCSDVFAPTPDDCYSSHAPFHFDLSILDIYVPLKHGARLVLIGEEVGKDPLKLAALIADTQISVWYSTPSVLTMLTEYGHLEKHDYSSLRMILFAGEVFPIKHLRKLTELLPGRRYFNLYGPTETNVCTYFELPPVISEHQDAPFPIGRACEYYAARVLDADGQDVPRGESGELCISGSGVMQGYWNLPEQSQRVFFTAADGRRWYRTGDLVTEPPDGNFQFLGRRDRMVKRRGFRVELGEIEATLYRHSNITEAAVLALSDTNGDMRVTAFVSSGGSKLSIIELKRFCADRLPAYMIPDAFTFRDALPKTSTDKIDYELLKSGA